jgi:hypothetical protein
MNPPRAQRRRRIGDQVISLANLLGRPVRDGSGDAFAQRADVTLHQTEVRLRSAEQTVSRRARQPGDIALARDVLDRQLVDVAGVQVVQTLFGLS